MDGAQIFRSELAKIVAGGGSALPQGDFNAKVAAIAKRDGCALHEAMSKARIEHPADFVALQRQGFEPDRPIERAPPAGADAQERFVAKAREIADRDKLPLHAAMSRTRHEHPELFDRLD